MYFFDRVQLPQFATSAYLKAWNLAGYKEFALHSWFRGPVGATLSMELTFNQLSGMYEKVVIGSGGFWIGTKTYPVFGPNVVITLHNPSAPMEADIRVYAACCPDPPRTLGHLLPFLRPRD
jgi:hypothetical protein